jgi:hypothetical protein
VKAESKYKYSYTLRAARCTRNTGESQKPKAESEYKYSYKLQAASKIQV